MFEFNFNKLVTSLSNVNTELRPLFAALVAERLHQNAVSFFEHNAPDFLDGVTNALELLWRYDAYPLLKQDDIEQALAICLEAITFAEEMDSEDSLYASDAVAAIAYGLRAINCDDARESAWAAQRAYDTVFRFAEANCAQTDINAQSVVQREFERQLKSIESLKCVDKFSCTDVINNLRTTAQKDSETVFAK